MPTHLFPDERAAYSWAYEILDVWRAGKGFDPDPEIHGGGTGAMGAIILAIDIERIADRSDPGRQGGGRLRWIAIYYGLYDVTPWWSDGHSRQAERGIRQFSVALENLGLIEKSACNRGNAMA